MRWSDERVELLKKLWGDGLTATQIAARLGGTTSNAVIGKVHRMHLPQRDRTSSPAGEKPAPRLANGNHAGQIAHRIAERKKPPPRREGSKAGWGFGHIKPAARPAPAAEPVAILPSRNLTLLELEDGMCRMVTGGNLYCGNPTGSKRESYCEGHAYQIRGTLKKNPAARSAY